jgi:acetyl esterase
MPLDPEVAAFLESQQGLATRSSLDIEATRSRMRRNAALTGSAPTLAVVEDLSLSAKLKARQYWPAKSDSLPLIVYFHGGRFISGDLESHDPLCRQLAQATNSRVLAVDYRLSPEHPFPAAADDARSALAWAIGVSASIAVMGDSAGANLAAVAAHHQQGCPQLVAQVLVYPMMDPTCSLASHREFVTGFGPSSEDMQRGWHLYLQNEPDLRSPMVSPLYQQDLHKLPPTMVLTAEYDPLRDEGELYAQMLRDAGVPLSLRRYPGAIHGFFTMQAVLHLARGSLNEAAAFLRAQFSSHKKCA